jgi:hypothetical protein
LIHAFCEMDGLFQKTYIKKQYIRYGVGFGYFISNNSSNNPRLESTSRILN